MPVITFASSKGGAGKTTSAIILATTLARKIGVVVIDADPAQRLMSWSIKATVPGRLTIQKCQGELQIRAEIDRAKQTAEYVIIDLEGAATRLNAYVMGESDLVIIPMGDEQPDAEGAIETLAKLALEARTMRREISARILFARTEEKTLKSKLAQSINAEMREKVRVLPMEVHNRTAFSSLHASGGTLYGMDPEEVDGLAKAIANAEIFAEEVIQALGSPYH